jgi:hypothetical protein
MLHPLPSEEGGPRQSHRVTQQRHCSKHEVLGASPLWTIFVCHVAISGAELRRMPKRRSSANRVSAMSALIEYSEIRAPQESYSLIYEP